MSVQLNVFDFVSPSTLILPILPEINTRAWDSSQNLSNPSSRYQGYLNELCLQVILLWLHAEITPQAKTSFCTTALPSFWELVNGTVVDIDEQRMVVVPQESIDFSELRIPQEWVDIPEYIGDYYLGVSVNPDASYVCLWGYTTHAALKNRGSYDPHTRTYAIAQTDLIDDMSIFPTVGELCPNERTRTQIIPPPPLSPTQAENLIDRLANPAILAPRLQVPFATWSSLIANGGWRQSLYLRRLGLPEQFAILGWLERGVSQFASQLGWSRLQLQTGFAGARSLEQSQNTLILSRQLAIAGQSYELRIVPQTHNGERTWRFEFRNAIAGGAIPGGFKLRLLTEDLQPLPNNEDVATTATDLLFVEVALAPNEGIVWEIEPLPENYEREILRF
ncbi:DUF1822 family protein [Calothrix sp. NIES-3974]|uniref:DUF1822 family protein n=1 Tax=Calothrix sp. NIES-3974 TaxID=2005462 RepID=UPI000B5EC9E6|nr:DUF1822 family protein [Calothrix sp. NIES-3974]BAZ08088.1 hypothetical protein NIES3974_47570 [Calothrix sp. NIES-3974]